MNKTPVKAIVKYAHDKQTQEIITLHNKILTSLQISLEKAIRIGELLIEQKEKLKHGDFTPWIKTNLPFTDRTARNYMALYQHRDQLKTENISNLTSAYQALLPGERKEVPDSPCVIVKTDSIEPNPFFDTAKIPGLSIEWWLNVLKDDSCRPLPYWVLAVRRNCNKYQLICDHDRWAAMRIAGTKEARIVIVNGMTDRKMKSAIERFDNKWHQEYLKYLEIIESERSVYEGV